MGNDGPDDKAKSLVPIAASFGSAGIVGSGPSWGLWAVAGLAVYAMVKLPSLRYLRSERGRSSRWGPALRALMSLWVVFAWFWFAAWVLVGSVWEALPIAVLVVVILRANRWFWSREPAIGVELVSARRATKPKRRRPAKTASHSSPMPR